MAEAPARAGGAGGARASALSAKLDREAVAPAVSIATATLGSLGFGGEGGAGEGGGPGDWRVSARAEAATLSADGKQKTSGASGAANGAPRAQLVVHGGELAGRGGWTSYNPATGPR